MVAIYHSHTRSPAFPSRTDVELATWPDAAYLIVSLASDPPELAPCASPRQAARALALEIKARTAA